MKKIENSYKKSGVNIPLANRFVKHIARLSKKNDQKLKNVFSKSNIGDFGSCYDISKTNIHDPVLVSCTDGVGTKLELANKFKKFDSIGIDLVAMCINDLIVQGAKPLFFLDYIALGKLDLKKIKKIFKGILKGCKYSNCQLIGGETAEMPGVYDKNKFDLAGFSVGIVSKKKILSKKNVKKNNIVVAIPSSGLHSNGYSLVRKILSGRKINNNLKKILLTPTKIYSREILKLSEKKLINAAANITGGGITENLIRSVPEGLCACIDLSLIRPNYIFKWLKSHNIKDEEMLKTFNCGVGFCVIIDKKYFPKLKKFFSKKYKPYVIGSITKYHKKIKFKNNIQW